MIQGARLQPMGSILQTEQRAAGVRSIERAFAVLELLAHAEGAMTLSELAAASELPLPSVHRLSRTLVDLGYVRQEPSRKYTLGPWLLFLSDGISKMLDVVARPHLSRLVEEIGETANLAMLDGGDVVYVAQVSSRHPMRMFTDVGVRVLPHCTAVGKAMMATMAETMVRAHLGRTGMPRNTEHTITNPDDFVGALIWSTEHGYAIDDGEQEIGVRCVAVAIPGFASRLAISISGPATRMDEATIDRAVPALVRASQALAVDLA